MGGSHSGTARWSHHSNADHRRGRHHARFDCGFPVYTRAHRFQRSTCVTVHNIPMRAEFSIAMATATLRAMNCSRPWRWYRRMWLKIKSARCWNWPTWIRMVKLITKVRTQTSQNYVTNNRTHPVWVWLRFVWLPSRAEGKLRNGFVQPKYITFISCRCADTCSGNASVYYHASCIFQTEKFSQLAGHRRRAFGIVIRLLTSTYM